jgi:hypothetical protein
MKLSTSILASDYFITYMNLPRCLEYPASCSSAPIPHSITWGKFKFPF